MAHTDEKATAKKEPPGRLFIAGVVSLFLSVPAFIELVLAVSPGVKAYAAYGMLSGTLCGILVMLLRGPRRTSLSIFAVLFLGLTVLHSVPWTSRKEFLRHSGEVRIGMATEEVVSILRGYEYLEVPHSSDLIVRTFFHSRTGRFDSDCGVVTFAGGRVAQVEFLPD